MTTGPLVQSPFYLAPSTGAFPVTYNLGSFIISWIISGFFLLGVLRHLSISNVADFLKDKPLANCNKKENVYWVLFLKESTPGDCFKIIRLFVCFNFLSLISKTTKWVSAMSMIEVYSAIFTPRLSASGQFHQMSVLYFFRCWARVEVS